MIALPVPRSVTSQGVLRSSDRPHTSYPVTLRIGGAFAAEVVDAASDLCRRAFRVAFVIDEADSDVVVSEVRLDAPAAGGIDPRPVGRASRSEAHRIRPDGARLAVDAESAEGLFRALITIAAAGADGLPDLRVEDHPDRAWRGLSLDVVRHWFEFDEVLRIIDLLALHKMNVLHLHLTDTQAWRFELPGYPTLAAEQHFTTADLDRIEAYARDRFVVVVPEIDVPGHVPESLTRLPGIDVADAEHPILAHLDSASAGVEQLLRTAFIELARRFSSPHLHFGGDEAFGAPDDAYLRTVTTTAEIIRLLGRTPVGWQEAVRSGALGPADLVQLWISERDRFDVEKMKRVAPVEYHGMIDRAGDLFALSTDDPQRIGAAGIPAIISCSDPLYLDRRPSDPSTDAAQNTARERLGNPGYPATPTTSVLDWTPERQPDIAAAEVQVAGIEAALWCETVESFDDAAQLLLPRLALIAQQAWGPAPRDAVLVAAADHSPVWSRLGFDGHYRSTEIHFS